MFFYVDGDCKLDWTFWGVRLGFATVGFCFFFFSFLLDVGSGSSLSRFAGFFLGGVVSPVLSPKHQTYPQTGLPSSCFRFLLLAGITAISPFGVPLPSPLTLSLSFVVFFEIFSLTQDSICFDMPFRVIGRLHLEQEIKSGDSFMGILPKIRRSRGSSCLATGDPISELVGGD